MQFILITIRKNMKPSYIDPQSVKRNTCTNLKYQKSIIFHTPVWSQQGIWGWDGHPEVAQKNGSYFCWMAYQFGIHLFISSLLLTFRNTVDRVYKLLQFMCHI